MLFFRTHQPDAVPASARCIDSRRTAGVPDSPTPRAASRSSVSVACPQSNSQKCFVSRVPEPVAKERGRSRLGSQAGCWPEQPPDEPNVRPEIDSRNMVEAALAKSILFLEVPMLSLRRFPIAWIAGASWHWHCLSVRPRWTSICLQTPRLWWSSTRATVRRSRCQEARSEASPRMDPEKRRDHGHPR